MSEGQTRSRLVILGALTLVDFYVVGVRVKYLVTLRIPNWDAKVIFDAYQTALIQDINLDGPPEKLFSKKAETASFSWSL